ncbi:putative Gamma-D-glutamyl-meso-diaminopimelate peptidase [Nostocoides jenkinsii Ben 74]|uniref:Putative Gamma-D-glutamyl-meso-diaminopimelate peptidase n=1 Tax=Nostocoides jenkinsii Ben 74 TaxID=1193518 RepID=A0A077MGS3_9MICO|nr:putative Gamma-D-glutamyl-meso-diaminopimelate peptidase [Tetrasphaera jenkinsii Ben 74]
MYHIVHFIHGRHTGIQSTILGSNTPHRCLPDVPRRPWKGPPRHHGALAFRVPARCPSDHRRDVGVACGRDAAAYGRRRRDGLRHRAALWHDGLGHRRRQRTVRPLAHPSGRGPLDPERHLWDNGHRPHHLRLDLHGGAGDTLSGIAAATGSSVSAIAATNGITTYDFIHVGQSLTIPGAGTTPKRPASTTGSYTVQSGDTLSGIAASTGSTVAAIAKASGISPSSFLQIGQRLTIPTRTDRGDSGSTTSGTTTTTGAAPGSSEWADTMPSRSEIRDLISATASAYGVDPRLALAIGWQESGWQQGVTSSVGAVGAMQVMPQSGEWAGSLIGRTLNLRDAHDNVTAGVVIIRQLTAMAKDRDEVIAAYYQGLGSVQERGWYSDTRQYVANVNYFMTRV